MKNPVKASIGGIFRNNEGCCVGCFAQRLGDGNALVAELSAVMTAIELAASKGYWSVWLESDSQLVLQAFKSNMIIRWSLRNRWYNCLVITHNMRFFASHIYREGNVCADGLANFGLTLSNFELFWFNDIADFIKGEYIRNRLGMSNYRFTTF